MSFKPAKSSSLVLKKGRVTRRVKCKVILVAPEVFGKEVEGDTDKRGADRARLKRPKSGPGWSGGEYWEEVECPGYVLDTES